MIYSHMSPINRSNIDDMNKTALWVGVLVVVAAGAFLWTSRAQAPAFEQGASSSATQDNTQGTSAQASNTGASADVGASAGNVPAQVGTTAGAPMSATVTYDGSSFSPSSVAIEKGGTVMFQDNASSGTDMWIASGPHPTHTGYDTSDKSMHCGADYTGAKPFDQCQAGRTFNFTFDKAGSFSYHDHLNATAHGTIVVQ